MEDEQAIGANPGEPESTGRANSGRARMAKLSPEERSELASRAATERWKSTGPVYDAEAWGDLQIADQSIPCAVLVVDGEVVRVVSERGLIKSFGGKRGGAHWRRSKQSAEAASLPALLSAANLRDCISPELHAGLTKRYPYRLGGRRGSGIAHGLRAELYPMICEVFLKARDGKLLVPSQEDFAKAADTLIRGLAHVGIIALVDEATGYQNSRAQDALARILEAFIAKELQPWVKTFPADYYECLFRLRGLDYRTDSVKRPQYFGCLTNDIVYRRLAPGVLTELKKVAARNESGRPTHKYFQKLTSNLGYPKLREHLGAVVAVMRLSDDYRDFIMKLDRLYPRYNETMQLPFLYELNGDDGRGL